MFTKEEIALAKPCYEAIKKIAERQEKECLKCKGSGLIRTKHYPTGNFNTEATINCLDCNGTGKVKGKWEWEPEMGEFFLDDEGNLRLVALFEGGQIDDHEGFLHKPVEVIPLLHWERIEQLLEGMGYEIGIDKLVKITSEQEKHPDKFEVIIEKAGEIGGKENWISGSTRQEAVQKAVIELGKKE